MTNNIDIPSLERITFFNGQRLTATDLAALQTARRELRWLHNRSLHGWGIGTGFAVTGERGARTVTIEAGYGLDCQGREIILTETQTKPVPAVAGDGVFYLVAAYQPNEDQPVAERRAGVCQPEGTVRLREAPLLAWRKPPAGLWERKEPELVLAQAWVQNCRLSRPLSLAARRYARPAQQPYIAAGQTPTTAWQPWLVGAEEAMIGVYREVDTSAARFRTTPRYMAHIVGDRYLDDAAVDERELVAIGFPAVVEATPDRFTLQVLLPEMADDLYNPSWLRDDPSRVSDIFERGLNWCIVWMGIEG